jgi:hypothetical protein
VPGQPALIGATYGLQIAPIPLNTVVFSDPALAEAIAIQRVGAMRTPTNTVEVAATLVNCGAAQVPLRIRTTFFDAEQRTTEGASAWKTVFVPPRGLGSYSESSIARERVSTYLIEIAPLGPRA